MTDTAIDDLGKFEDDTAAIEVTLEDGLNVEELADAFSKARLEAMSPKPTIKEMIEAVAIQSYEIEGGQERLMLGGVRSEPYKPYMRRAAVLTAALNLLSLIEANKDAVKRVLRGRS
jgi:hypothetical protein